MFRFFSQDLVAASGRRRPAILIIIIISLGETLLSYIANTSATHALAHGSVQVRCIGASKRDKVNDPPFMAGSWVIEINTRVATRFPRGFVRFSRINKLLGRTETRNRDRMYCQTIRTVRDISRDDRARIATCSLRTPTDRQI